MEKVTDRSSLAIIRNQINELEYGIYYYTEVEPDEERVSFGKNALEEVKTVEKELKTLEIIKEHLSFKDDSFTYHENNQEKKQLSIIVESKDTECSIHINFKKQEEFDLLCEVFPVGDFRGIRYE